jgi:hypothetical protein
MRGPMGVFGSGSFSHNSGFGAAGSFGQNHRVDAWVRLAKTRASAPSGSFGQNAAPRCRWGEACPYKWLSQTSII